MPQIGLGVIDISSPGVPVRITNNLTDPTAHLPCQSILIQALSNASHTNIGRVYILDHNGTRLATLAVPTANTIPSFSCTIPGTLALSAELFYIDSDQPKDGVDASYLGP
jgi:hypothetical protein